MDTPASCMSAHHSLTGIYLANGTLLQRDLASLALRGAPRFSRDGNAGPAGSDTQPLQISGSTEKERSRCHCFSLCSMAAVHAFVASAPAVINSTRSPWSAYLRIVYGEAPRLPFALASLRFFYANDPHAWPLDVHWPMASCSNPAAPNKSLPGARPSLRCRKAECERWSWSAPPDLGHSGRFSDGVHTVLRQALHFGSRRWRSRGTLLLVNQEPLEPGRDSSAPMASAPFPSRPFHWPLHSAASSTSSSTSTSAPSHSARGGRSLHGGEARRRFWPSGTVAEVVRMRTSARYSEGMHGYGVWFYAAPGSGMWLCTGGRTLVIPATTKEFLQGLGSLGAAWAEATPAARAAAAPDIEFLRKRRKGRDLFPAMAHGLGYSTIQRSQGNYPMLGTPELVALCTDCMHAQAPVGTCPPNGVVWRGLPTSEGGGGLAECACDESEPMLNCAHVAWRRSEASTNTQPLSVEDDLLLTAPWRV